MASRSESLSREELVKKFQIMDSMSNVLKMILDGGDAAVVSSTVAKLHGRFADCEALLDNLPGAEMTKAEQLRKIEELTAAIAKRKALVAKYGMLDTLQKLALEPSPVPSPTVSVPMQGFPAPPPPPSMSTPQPTTVQTDLMPSNADHLFFTN